MPESRMEQQADEVALLRDQLLTWRRTALHMWAIGVSSNYSPAVPDACQERAASRGDAEHWQAELDAMRRTLSWRVTKPLRAARPLLGRLRRAVGR
ncbi:MAG: hypothetical protein FWG11_06060 [Promicromonosporaceae bacterium]|nr:hypothetical protein [Promicromonosporaceae bacterium]